MATPSSVQIDYVAKEIALRKYGLPDCLHVPIAAVDQNAIESYIGTIDCELGSGSPSNAFLINAYPLPPIDDRLPIWGNPASAILRERKQVWVQVPYTRYRSAYKKAFPYENIAGKVLSHALNRRVATLKGYQYVRLTPTSRGANSSSAFTEQWSVAHNDQAYRRDYHQDLGLKIQYADLLDILLMMDLRLGGGVQDIANAGQELVRRK